MSNQPSSFMSSMQRLANLNRNTSSQNQSTINYNNNNMSITHNNHQPIRTNYHQQQQQQPTYEYQNQPQNEWDQNYSSSPGQATTYKRVKKELDVASFVTDNQENTTPVKSSRNTSLDAVNTNTRRQVSPIQAETKQTETKKSKPATGRARNTTKKPTTDKNSDDQVFIDIEKNEGNAFDYNEFQDSTPVWAKKEFMKDKNQRRPGDPQFDHTSLYVPESELKNLTPTMRQYWKIKSDNYDKIVLFKLGKFYEIFYEDALICHKELDLSWMGKAMSVGFPEKTLDRYAYILVNRGYKVCVVEQTETPKQMEERLRNQKGIPQKEKIVKRAAVQIMSKGTYVDPNDTNMEPRILLAVRCKKSLIAVSYLDIGSNIFTMGAFLDDSNFTIFKTFISQVRPVEVVFETMETPYEIIKIVRNSPANPLLSPINDAKCWSTIMANANLEKYFHQRNAWPEGLQDVLKLGPVLSDLIMLSLSGLLIYLGKMLILENVLQTARFQVYDHRKHRQSRMILDSQALQHLEILDVEYAGKSHFEGSLLSFVDKTATPFGKRLLRKWICAPLLDINAINERLDAVEELEGIHEIRDQFLSNIRSLPDLERTCAKIYNQSVKKNASIVMFEDISATKLKEFRKLLDNLKLARNYLATFSECQLHSSLLKRLTTFDNCNLIIDRKSQNMPEIGVLLKEMSDFISWEGPKKDIPVPRPGIDRDYDNCKKEIEAIEQEFTNYLKFVQQGFGGNQDIYYSHTKHRYELDIPAKLVEGNKKPKQFEFSSKKQDRERFVTQEIKDLVEKLEEVEERLKVMLNLFVCFLFSHFHRHYPVWDRFIDGIAQLDCLISLSKTSFVADGAMCRPQLSPPNERAFMDIRDSRHPCLSITKSNFVSNDILLGDTEGNGNNRNVMLLTGPNMGGKSTILRQACVTTILAQIGCYVPASSCKMSVVDRIFTRIGASDKLSEGKSTFYIEMEETVNVIKYGTMNSLAIMDELGRGTSTFDGVSIAYAVMKYIVNTLGCRTFFATHYHVLLEEFRDVPQITFFHMGSRIDYNSGRTDDKNGRVIFLYKLAQGECSNSFGLNIARISGLNQQIMKVAKQKADEFEKNLNIREAVRTNKVFQKIVQAFYTKNPNNIDESFRLLQDSLLTLSDTQPI